jgi:hypothetical protein
MEPEGSISYSQEPSTGPYPEPYQSNPHHPIPSYLSKIHFDIVHPPSSWSSQWSLSFWLSYIKYFRCKVYENNITNVTTLFLDISF